MSLENPPHGAAASAAIAAARPQPVAHAAKVTECAKIGVRGCVNDEREATIEKRFGTGQMRVLNPAAPEADLPRGTGARMPVRFDGRAAAPPEAEAAVSEGYAGKCPS